MQSDCFKGNLIVTRTECCNVINDAGNAKRHLERLLRYAASMVIVSSLKEMVMGLPSCFKLRGFSCRDPMKTVWAFVLLQASPETVTGNLIALS